MLKTHREELEKWILENLPLLILVSNHRNIDFTEILGEQENQTDRAMGKQKTGRNMSNTVIFPKAWLSLMGISVIVPKNNVFSLLKTGVMRSSRKWVRLVKGASKTL